jgi:hypothetical protein
MSEIIEGISHITDLDGYDHMLFLLALSAPFVEKDFKKLIFLASAFTVGHSLTLAAAAMGILRFNSSTVELLIVVSIAITALLNFLIKESRIYWWNYLIAVGFGLIHGMGFSSYFRMMYSNDDGWLLKLLKFNIGVEIGQLFVLAIIIGIGHVVIRVLKVKGLYWSYALSMLSLLIAIRLIFDNLNQ